MRQQGWIILKQDFFDGCIKYNLKYIKAIYPSACFQSYVNFLVKFFTINYFSVGIAAYPTKETEERRTVSDHHGRQVWSAWGGLHYLHPRNQQNRYDPLLQSAIFNPFLKWNNFCIDVDWISKVWVFSFHTF